MPVSEAYMERQGSQAFGPIAAKRRSQSLIKMDRSGTCCADVQNGYAFVLFGHLGSQSIIMMSSSGM